MPALSRTIYSSDRYVSRINLVSDSNEIIVTFGNFQDPPTLHGHFWGEEFLIKSGINCIGVKSSENDWYQTDETPDLISAIRAATEGMRRIGYGDSMGGYGAINFSEDLELDHVVVIAPQFSINPLIAPYDTRFHRFSEKLDFAHDKISTIRPIKSGYIVYDPVGIDALHASNILKRHNLTPIKLNFCDHFAAQMLLDMGMLSSFSRAALVGHIDLLSLRNEIRANRWNSPTCLKQAAVACYTRGDMRRALKLSERAAATPSKWPFSVYQAKRTYSYLLWQVGRKSEALYQMANIIDDPHYASDARRELLVLAQQGVAAHA